MFLERISQASTSNVVWEKPLNSQPNSYFPFKKKKKKTKSHLLLLAFFTYRSN